MRARYLGHAALLAFVLVVAVVPNVLGADLVRRGFAAHYAPGVMTQVSRNRGLPPVGCMVASPYAQIGDWLTVTSARGSKRCRVTDVPQARDRAAILRRGIVVELDWTSAQRLCGLRTPGGAPPRACPVTVRR